MKMKQLKLNKKKMSNNTMTRKMMDGMSTPFPTGPGDLAGDLLRGAGAIAVFLFGSAQERRKVYHLAETSRLPTFHLGSLLCARKSVLLQWIAEQEKRGGQSGK